MTTQNPMMSRFGPRPPSTDEERDYYALSEHVYAAFAPFYDLVAYPLRKVRGQVATLAGTNSRSRVLDVATGTGSQAIAFAKSAGEVVGIDLSEAMLRIARKKNRAANLKFQRADATELPFEDESFDIACVSFALHEMPDSVRERAVKEVVRVTKPNGTIVVVDYGSPPGVIGSAFFHVVKLFERDHYVEFIHSDLPALLRRAGVEVRAEHHALARAVRILMGCPAPGKESAS
ncbi:MAG TPA: methyltransferase domain-containing protein [Polyangiaceae bacterium]